MLSLLSKHERLISIHSNIEILLKIPLQPLSRHEMKNKLFTFIAISALSLTASATGISGMGTWSSTLLPLDVTGDGVVDVYYDTVENLTWLKDANPFGRQTWDSALSMADSSIFFGVAGWRLPSMKELSPNMFSTTASEMSVLFYSTLGNFDASAWGPGGPGTGGGLKNTGPFVNLQSSYYWLGTQKNATQAWAFGMGVGFTNALDKTPTLSIYNNFSMLVHEGRLASSIPEPSNISLMLIGLIATAIARARNNCH
jgi:hypothetical protein